MIGRASVSHIPGCVRLGKALRNGFCDALELLFPSRCMACGRFLSESRLDGETYPGISLCEHCLRQVLPQHGKTFCPRCGCFFLGNAQDVANENVAPEAGIFGAVPSRRRKRCVHCPQTDFFFSQVIPLGEYQSTLRDAILAMKEERDGHRATHFSRLLYRFRQTEFEQFSPDVIVPTPMHFTRRWIRGVNAPEWIADTLGQSLDVPVWKRFLRRVVATKLQFSLKPGQRARNVKKGFAVRTPLRLFRRFSPNSGNLENIGSVENFGSLGYFEKDFRGKRILLVDDILTTGATANEISRVLVQHGAGPIAVAVLGKSVFPLPIGKQH